MLQLSTLERWLRHGAEHDELVDEARCDFNHPLNRAVRWNLLGDFPLYRGIGVRPSDPILRTHVEEVVPFFLASFSKSRAIAEHFAERAFFFDDVCIPVVFQLSSGPVNGLDIDLALAAARGPTLQEVIIAGEFRVAEIRKEKAVYIVLQPK